MNQEGVPSFDVLTQAISVDEGIYEVEFHPNTELWGVNGGFIGVAALRWAADFAGMDRPATMSIAFLRGMRSGKARFEFERLKESSITSLVSVRVIQENQLCGVGHVWFVAPHEGPSHNFTSMPIVPSPGELKSFEEVSDEELAPFWKEGFEQKTIHLVDPNRRARVPPQCMRWFRYRGQSSELPKHLEHALKTIPLIDTMWFLAAQKPYQEPFITTTAPTLQLNVEFCEFTESTGWLLCDATADFAQDGTIHASADVWSEDGELIARGTMSMSTSRRKGMYAGQ